MVGEMRDLETIQAVLTLVETGHLVISTLHTINAPQTISRIIDAFPPEKANMIATQLSLSLEMIISQRLIETAD
jgi:twitching motility protein PilT